MTITVNPNTVASILTLDYGRDCMAYWVSLFKYFNRGTVLCYHTLKSYFGSYTYMCLFVFINAHTQIYFKKKFGELN